MPLPSGTFAENYQQDMALVRTRMQWGLLLLSIVLVAIFPFFASTYMLGWLVSTAIILIAVQGLNILQGYTGQFSIGQAAFMAVGAYTSAILTTTYGLPFLVALPCSGIVAALVGGFFGIPSLRVKGFYLVMSTLAAQYIIEFAIVHTPDLTGGHMGIMALPPKFAGIIFNTEFKYYFLVMPMVALMTFISINIGRLRFGRAFIAIRDNDLAAETQGINPFVYKTLAFMICAFYAGISGSLWAHWVLSINLSHFTLWTSIFYLAMVIVGGMGTQSGVFFGVIFIQGLQEMVLVISPMLSDLFPSVATGLFAGLGKIVYGVVFALFLIVEPRGISYFWMKIKNRYRLWPYTY